MDIDLNDPMILIIGKLAEKCQRPPEGWALSDQVAWRTGYQNAVADLIAELYSDSPGGKRLSAFEIWANDCRRQTA